VPRVELPHHVLLPGLMNMHAHSAMTLLRGYADDLDLNVWLNEHIWPAEKRWLGEEFVADGVRLAMAEMLRGGTTFFNDNYFFPEVTATAAAEAGMRAISGLPIIEFPTPWAQDLDGYIDRGLEVHADWRDHPLVTTAFAPHAPYTVHDEALGRIRDLSERHDLPVHMHVLETEWEIRHSLEHHEQRPLDRLDRLGLLNTRLLAVHMTQLSPADVARLADAGVHVVHCPESNLKLASGVCPVPDLLAAGVNVCLGTDGAASNNDLDLLAEARTSALLAKGVSGDPKAVSAHEALEMLTINAARAIGREGDLGSVEAGKLADLCAVDLRHAATQPLHHVVSQLVYATSASQVSDVWVGGRRLLEGGRLTTLDLDALLDKAAFWAGRLGRDDAAVAGVAT
jgi:5-methylthioadenosine/S-adenosylhomocysteine deaminase